MEREKENYVREWNHFRQCEQAEIAARCQIWRSLYAGEPIHFEAIAAATGLSVEHIQRLLPHNSTSYSLADALTDEWPSYMEIIEGEPIPPVTPPVIHQKIWGALLRQIDAAHEGEAARYVVRPFEKKGDDPATVSTVLFPDILLVLDERQMDEHGYIGAPPLIMEILSPESKHRDLTTKLEIYQRAGVKEYWTVHPDAATVQVYVRDDDGAFQRRAIYHHNDTVKIGVLEGGAIDLRKVLCNEYHEG